VVAQTQVVVNRSPFPFQLAYNPSQIYAEHQYAMTAEVVDQGRIIYRTQQAIPVSPASGRAQIALAPITSAASPYDQVTGWYQNYLNRTPTQQELYTWNNHLNRGQPATDIQAYLLGSSEYFDRYQNDPNLYMYGVYRSLYNNEPSPQQMQILRQQYEQVNGIRSQFVQQMMRSQG
jgi:hypothetical protein